MLSRGTLTLAGRLVVLGLLVVPGLACWNPFAPNPSGPSGGIPDPPTTPEKLMVRLDYAMNERDWEEYAALLDGDYWFSEPNDVDSLKCEWGRDVDVWGQEEPHHVTGVKAIFEGVQFFDFQFEETRRTVELGEEHPGEGHDAHPDEDWQVFYGPVTMFMLKHNGVDGFRVDQNMTFKLRKNPETKLWYIIRWIDDPLGTT